jgi:hypothetical protein
MQVKFEGPDHGFKRVQHGQCHGAVDTALFQQGRKVLARIRIRHVRCKELDVGGMLNKQLAHPLAQPWAFCGRAPVGARGLEFSHHLVQVNALPRQQLVEHLARQLERRDVTRQYSHTAWPCPAAASQAFWLTRGLHLRAGLPGVDLNVQAGINSIANACADFVARRQALAGLDGAIGQDGLT